jgi:hypothetical protein
MENMQCFKCKGQFREDEITTQYYREYAGGKSWPSESSPCCGASFDYFEDQVITQNSQDGYGIMGIPARIVCTNALTAVRS